MEVKDPSESDEEGVSPVVGTILIIGITVIAVAGIAYFVMSYEPPEPGPMASLEFKGAKGRADNFLIEHRGGDLLTVKDLTLRINGEEGPGDITSTGTFGAGTSIKVRVNSELDYGDRIALVHEPSGTVIAEKTVKEVLPGGGEITPGWRAVGEWTGTVSAPSGWSLVEGWSGSVAAPAGWGFIESWSGTVNAPATGWSNADSWSGAVSVPATGWTSVESWSGGVSAPSGWSLVESWSGSVSAPAGWQLIESWSGGVSAPSGWSLVEGWSGSVSAPAGWQLIESWSGGVSAPSGWNLIESWSGTIFVGNQPPSLGNLVSENITRTSADLAVDVSDLEGDDLSWVAFLDDSDDSLLENYNSGSYSEPQTFTYSWTNLSENTDYAWYSQSADSNGNVGTSSVVSFTTDPNYKVEYENMENNIWLGIGNYYGSLEVDALDRNGDNIQWLAFIVNGEVVENDTEAQEEPHHYIYENWFDPETTYSWWVKAKDSFGEVSTSETKTFTTGSGGCPYLYGWDGESYELINATMPQPILKRYETTSYQETGMLKPRDNYYDLNLFQKLPEKAWINNLSLQAIDHPKGTEVLTDQNGRIYTIADPQPVTATDEEGRDITHFLENQDQKYWTSDLKERNFENLDDLVDHVTLTLPERSDSGIKLIVRGRQTFLAELSLWSVYHYILGTPNFGYITGLLENDAPSSLGSAFDNAFGRFSSIRLQYWNGKEWVDFGRIGILKAFFESTVVPIDLGKISGNRIRLSMTAGLYDIDQILVDYSQARTVVSKTLEPVQAIKYGEEGSENVLKKVSKVDNRYAVIKQGEYINYKFRQMDPPKNGMERTFVLPTGGYYYLTGPEVPENRIYNLPLAENLASNPYSFESWILSRYAHPENYPYTEYFQMSTAEPLFETSK